MSLNTSLIKFIEDDTPISVKIKNFVKIISLKKLKEGAFQKGH